MYRQGDVLFVPIDSIPTERGRVQTRDPRGRIVLAEGEATGHAHAISEEGAHLYGEDPERRFLRVLDEGGVDLVHEEHATIHLEPGSYRVIRQRHWLYNRSLWGAGQIGWVQD